MCLLRRGNEDLLILVSLKSNNCSLRFVLTHFLIQFFVMSNIEPVEGFDVFKSSKKARAKGKEEESTKNEISENPNKELNRRMEVWSCLIFFPCFVKGKE